MADASTPPPIDLAREDGLEKFMLRGKRQVAQLLQDLIERRCLISAHTGGGHSFMTAVLRVDAERERVVLDASPDADANRRALAAERVQCVTVLDHIRIQFALGGVSSAQEKSHPALSTPFPKEMLRLQRREFYRLKVPLAHEVTCLLQAEDLARKPVRVSVRVVDISGGGIGIMMAPDAAELVIGAELPGCTLRLPDGEPIDLTLEVRNITRLTQRNGVEMLRVGLRFAELPRAADARIQRYIFNTERELNAKERGGL
ncbi:flagellar brake protein [Thauera sp.]|jgi:c-di-GMP-binding flagellar brake protein YcgR|uniref:flagellar brake protein n=1 Tax=Thauera sp. TaxID=1905334 RepID=UPI002A3600E7|nr:flagellar brake protein [Thauera sp.]MDX9884885.1 flagellar brake protein [Thauera sp.]